MGVVPCAAEQKVMDTQAKPMPQFELFESEHVGALLLTALLSALLVALVRRSFLVPRGAAQRAIVCWGLAAVTAGALITDQVSRLIDGTWTFRETLPLHLCNIAVFVVAAALPLAARCAWRDKTGAGVLHGSRRERKWAQFLYELAYYWGIGGSTQALLTPDILEGFPHPIFVRFFVTHGGIVAGVMVMTFGCGLQPRRGSLARVWLVTQALAAVVMVVNALTGGNYMFLCGPPARASLYDYFGQWPYSLITLEIVGALVMALCYLPWWWLDRRERQASEVRPSQSTG